MILSNPNRRGSFDSEVLLCVDAEKAEDLVVCVLDGFRGDDFCGLGFSFLTDIESGISVGAALLRGKDVIALAVR